MRVAYSHDWLNGMRGGERCLEALIRLFGRGTIHTLFYEPEKVSELIRGCEVRPSFLRYVPGASGSYKTFLPFFPLAIRSFKPDPAVELVISTSHCVAKAIRRPAAAVHLCYCFTPMRYAWLFFEEYFGKFPAPLRLLVRWGLGGLRRWDAGSNGGVTRFIAISRHVRERIVGFYGREADVIYPPARTDFFTPTGETRDDFFLMVSALVPYKRLEMAVRAFNRMGRRLVVIGDGPEKKRLMDLAGPTVEILGWKSDEMIREYYRRAKALIFPGEEDFGIVPVEAQACGTPVIAYAVGGALETVLSGQTGIFFKEPTQESLERAVLEALRVDWDPVKIRRQAERFSEERFSREFKELAGRYVRDAAVSF